MEFNKRQDMAKKMESKSYTNVRCGHCGKFGHSHEDHRMYEARKKIPQISEGLSKFSEFASQLKKPR
jgi:hypothetical protein